MTLVDRVLAWRAGRPLLFGPIRNDANALQTWHTASEPFMAEVAAPTAIAARARLEWRASVLRVHSQFVRRHHHELMEIIGGRDLGSAVNELGSALPAVVPSAEQLQADGRRPLADKVGFEYAIAVLFGQLLSEPRTGRRLLEHARRPLPQAMQALPAFIQAGRADLGLANIRREGPIAFVEIANPDALNAEDDAVLDALEICVDLALLDDRVEVGVLRGARMTKPKYLGRRVFCSGINLSELYAGRISCAYYLRRELGLVSKLYRGLRLDEVTEIEKPWVAAVDTHAIGGGCQLVLVMDHVVAERGATLSLPAKNEGIIPGAANLRLGRFIGARAARAALFFGKAIPVDSEEGRCLVDQVVADDRVGSAVEAAAESMVTSGLVSLGGNRKALRVGQEPIDVFREYMAHFAIAQADCHFSATLTENIERHWLRRRARADAAAFAPSSA